MVEWQLYPLEWTIYAFLAIIAYLALGFIIATFKTRGKKVSGAEFWGIVWTSPLWVLVVGGALLLLIIIF